MQRITEHRAAGHTTILITGAVRTFTRPLREFFDVIVAAELAVDDDGRCTGFLTTPPLVGESRAAWLKHYAALHDIDLARSFAYADSHSDLPMLQTVGNPVAVSPDIPLMRAAQRSAVVDRGVEDQAGTPRAGSCRPESRRRFPAGSIFRMRRNEDRGYVADTPSGRPPSTRRP